MTPLCLVTNIYTLTLIFHRAGDLDDPPCVWLLIYIPSTLPLALFYRAGDLDDPPVSCN